MRAGEGSEVHHGYELRHSLGVWYIYRGGKYLGCRRSVEKARGWVDATLRGDDPDPR